MLAADSSIRWRAPRRRAGLGEARLGEARQGGFAAAAPPRRGFAEIEASAAINLLFELPAINLLRLDVVS